MFVTAVDYDEFELNAAKDLIDDKNSHNTKNPVMGNNFGLVLEQSSLGARH